MNSKSYYKFFSGLLLLLFIQNVGLSQGENKSGYLPGKSSLGFVTASFKETDSVFANPGQGWMSNRLPSSIKYIRIGWADLEPEHRKYNWAPIDNAIAAGKPKGIKISLRIMTCSPHSKGYYTSPKWLFDEGCKSFEYLEGGDDPTKGGVRIPRIEPDYSDPVYLKRHAEFIKALADRYDPTSDLEFLDIGSYGYWGEWHTPHSVAVEFRRQIVDMYISSFKKTPLVFMSDDAEVLGYALEKGTGLRRDGVGSRWHEQNWIGSKRYEKVTAMADAWKHAPVVFEWYGNYDYLMRRGWSFDSAVYFMLRNHVTVINDNVGNVPLEKMPMINELAKRAGARFVLKELAHEKSVLANTYFEISMKWANTGVGKAYRHMLMRFCLIDDKNNVVYMADGKSDPINWLPGEINIKESLLIPKTIKKGEYRLGIKILFKDDPETSFRLAVETPMKNGYYVISKFIME